MSEQVTEYRSHTYSMRRLCVFLDRSEEEGLGFTRLAGKIWDFGFSSKDFCIFEHWDPCVWLISGLKDDGKLWDWRWYSG
jgi:hypothetical protein